MVQLSNVPRQQTHLRLAKDMSFSLGLWFRTRDQAIQFGSPVLPIPADYQGIDITDDEVRFVVYEQPRYGGATVINEIATLVEPEHGYARVDLQAADMDLVAGRTYNFTVGWLAEGYSGAVVQGEIEIIGNGVDDWAAETYTIDAPLNLGVELDERNHIHVVVDHVRAPDLSIGSVTSVPANEDAGAYFTGAYPHQLLHLRIPRGNNGAQMGGTVFLDNYPTIAGDGVTDDLAEITEVLTAVEAFGGGTVELGRKTYAISGPLYVPNGVWVQGLGREVSGFLCTSATAKLKVGDWVEGSRPGGLYKIFVDGNGTGDPIGIVHFQSVFAQMLYCKVFDGSGDNILLDAAQNAIIQGCYSTTAGDAALAIRNGAGGYNFMGSHFTSSPKDLKIYDDDGVLNNAYPFGSAHIQFWGGIFESYANGEMIFDIQAGGAIHFWGTGFSVNGAITMSEGVVGRVGNEAFPAISTYVEFNGCTWNGGTNEYVGLEIVGNQYVTFSGENYIQKHTIFCEVVAGSPRIQQLGFFSGKSDVGQIFGASGTGSLVSLYNEHDVGEDYIMDPTRTTVLSSRVSGDVGQRYRFDAYGAHYWNGGDDFGTEAKLEFVNGADDNYLYVSKGGIYFAERLGRLQGAVQLPNGAVTINSRITNVWRAALTGLGHIASMDIQNGIAGSELRIEISWNEGGQAVNWDPDIVWPNGAPPGDTTGGTRTVVDLYYDDDYDKWVAYNVAYRIPLDGVTTYPQPAVYQYTAAQVNTELEIPPGAKYGKAIAVSGGQGGGSGRQGAAGSVRCGGGGGGGGGWAEEFFNVADLGVTSLFITVGAGGAGGAAQAAADTNGNPGNQGGDSSVRTTNGAVAMANTIAHALSTASAVPGGGTNAAGTAGVGGYGRRGGQAGGAASATGGAGGVGALTGGLANGGGGAGGGISAANAAAAGGAGSWVYGRALLQPAGGTAGNPGTAGGNGPHLGLGQGGGGGGGNGGAGGAGGRGAGGGGGGASLNGTPSGAGGAGGTGFVEVTFWFN